MRSSTETFLHGLPIVDPMTVPVGSLTMSANLHAFVSQQMPQYLRRAPPDFAEPELQQIADQVSSALLTFGAQALAGIKQKHGVKARTTKFGVAIRDVVAGD